MHSSGQWIKTSLKLPIAPMKQLSGAQMAGVAMTYGRRYSYQAILGLASEDTDGKYEVRYATVYPIQFKGSQESYRHKE